MDNEERKQVQQETLSTVIKWLEITTREYYKRFGELPTINHMSVKADIMHSVLLQWMLDGNEPLKDPPPLRFSSPWHQLVVDGEGVAQDVWSGKRTAFPNQVIIEQTGWDILERTEEGYVATPDKGKTKWSVEPIESSKRQLNLQWQLKRIEDD